MVFICACRKEGVQACVFCWRRCCGFYYCIYYCLAANLMQYLEYNGLLSDRQVGFRKSRSTEDQMLLVYSEIAAMVDSGRIVDMVLLDFSKAFDVVLLEKLRSWSLRHVVEMD